jgi:regulator of protease activity HflC (stomatin/prohibitin superfamily)
MELTNITNSDYNKSYGSNGTNKTTLNPNPNHNNNHNFNFNLPSNARNYIRESNNLTTLPFHKTSILDKIMIGVTAITFYPLFKMVVVPDGQIGLGVWGSNFTFIKPGRHFLIHPTHRFVESVADNEQLIQHGNYTRIRVLDGEYGYGLNTMTGEPIILTPGTHVIDDPTFKWIGLLNLINQENKCGNFNFIRVETGQIGLAYINNQLEILLPSIHLLKSPDRFHSFVSTQQQIISLMHRVESADYISINIEADVFYYVSDAKLAFTKAFDSVKDLINSIKETAIATIALIVRSSTFAEIGRGNSSHPINSDHISINPPSYESYQKRLHDEFVERLQGFMNKTYGVFIENIRIKSLSIHDKELAKEIAAPAIIYAQTQAKLANVTSQTEIQTAEAHRDATMRKIKADADAYIAMKTAEGNSKAIGLQTVAESNKIITIAKANADAIIIEAESLKRKLELEGEGHNMFASKVKETELGSQLALAKFQTDAIKGVNKIVYAPISALPTIMLTNLNQNN